MPDCGICSELSNRLDEALLNVTVILKRLQTAIDCREHERAVALELELESALTRKSAAFRAWFDHRKGHDT